MTPFETLGIPNSSSVEDAKSAWRELRTKYHPDHGGDEIMFKAAKAAWEQIEGGYRYEAPKKSTGFDRGGFGGPRRPPQDPYNSWRGKPDDINDIFEDMKAANRGAAPRQTWTDPSNASEVVAHVSLREAFSGFNMMVPGKRGQGPASVNIPPGSPDGYRGKYNNSQGGTTTVTTRIEAGDFSLRGFDDQNNLFSAGLNIGDIEIEHEVDAIDLIMGAWITTVDFLGESLQVRVPEGFSPLQRLKIANKGYYGWLQEYGRPSNNRMNMYVRVKPKFNKIADIENAKIIELYNRIQGIVDAPDA